MTFNKYKMEYRSKPNSLDCYCRYLNVTKETNLYKCCNGNFFEFIKSLGIEKLPYDIKINDLIDKDIIKPNLYTSSVLKIKNSKNITDITTQLFIYFFMKEKRQYHHPFDNKLLLPNVIAHNELSINKNLNNIKSKEIYETYLPYWIAFVIIDVIEKYYNIEYFLNKEDGIKKISSEILENNKYWDINYKDTFNRISYYKTFISIYKSSKNQIRGYSSKELAEIMCNISDATKDILEDDMEKMLTLYKDWVLRDKTNLLNPSLKVLKKDILFLLEWLIGLNNDMEYYFTKKWFEPTEPRRWINLIDVIDFEIFRLEKDFKIYINSYINNSQIKEIQKEGTFNVDDLYIALENIEGFNIWIRAFSKLHNASTNKNNINFEQKSLIDYVLIFTIRTELLIRNLYKKYNKEPDIDDFKCVIKKIFFLNNNLKNKFNEEYAKTKIYDKPTFLYQKIESINSKQLNKKDLFFLKEILKFITARNYFAHHSYLDNNFNGNIDKLAGNTLEACLFSVYFINSLLVEKENK